mgnify:CR=1 FL=1
MEEQEIKERLIRYSALRLENENRLERLSRMKNAAQMPASRAGDGSQHTGSSGERMARAVEAYIEYEEQIRPKIEENLREIARTRSMVESLSDPMEREVLRLRYLDGETCRLMSWKDVACQLYGDDDDRMIHACLRLHAKALQSIKKRTKWQ